MVLIRNKHHISFSYSVQIILPHPSQQTTWDLPREPSPLKMIQEDFRVFCEFHFQKIKTSKGDTEKDAIGIFIISMLGLKN